ncbi:testis-expressed protein 11 [Nephila pilipes]|uniref:Testis-expressed protein 11 n=1 Tax=Nephila pilipes TaxID=299642 RepID=A0A8X6QBR5_NEPPI|nr:testis-expressed protein 11 [Nephila pilipes]
MAGHEHCQLFTPERDHMTSDVLILSTAQTDENGNSEETADWFCRVAWNLALKPEADVKHVFEFFDVCCRFLGKTKGPPARHKNALVFLVASGIHVVRENALNKKNEEEGRKDIIRKVLSAIDTCRNLEKENYHLLSMLYVYEFEIRIYKGDSSAEAVLKQMLHMPFVDHKVLQIVASVAHKHSSSNYKLITLALEGAINKIVGSPEGNIDQLSLLYHTSLQVLFFTQEYITSSVEEETLNACITLCKTLEENSSFQGYPETKILWLMTKCWNWGLNKLANGNPKKGHDWCALAMKYLQQLGDLKHLYEEKLQALYSSYFGSQTV